MPTGSGQFQLQDYIFELQSRGFKGFNVPDLTAYINRGYYKVAAASRWYWEEASDVFSLSPGSYKVDVSVAGTELPGFRSLDKLIGTTANQERRILEMDDDEFFRNWLSRDLTQASLQAEPANYYLWQSQLYILPPPNGVRTFVAYYHKDVTPLVALTDVPITPQKYDEAILQAALARCHQRALEPSLQGEAEAVLGGILDDMHDEEETRIGEHFDRVKPDDTWL